MNVFEIIEAAAARHLHRTAVIDGDRRASYADLLASAEEVAGELRSRGVGSGQRVALLCNDSIEYIALSLALLSLRAVIVPVSPSHSSAEVRAVLEEIDVAFLIREKALRSPSHGDGLSLRSARGKGLALHRCAVRGKFPAAYDALNPAFIRFSSGTTGASKGVLLSHERILERTDAADQALKMTGDDRVIWVLSMSYHFVVSILLFLRRGATIILCCREFLPSFLEAVSRHEGTFIYASPFHYQLMTQAAALSATALSKVRMAVSTAMRLPRADASRFRERFGFGLTEAYGIIEVGLPFVNSSGDPTKEGSVGRILPDYEVRIEGPDVGGVGEVCLKGRGMFDAYCSPWQEWDEVAPDGWFRTGDLGRIDADGFLFLAGREKNVINFAGMKVFPDEVESVLNQHPAVEESLVYGRSHDRYGELPRADIVLRAGIEATAIDTRELRRFCYRYLAPYKVPKGFECVPRLERTASGKLRRRIHT